MATKKQSVDCKFGHMVCGQLAGKACKSELARERGLIEARKRARKEDQE